MCDRHCHPHCLDTVWSMAIFFQGLRELKPPYQWYIGNSFSTKFSNATSISSYPSQLQLQLIENFPASWQDTGSNFGTTSHATYTYIRRRIWQLSGDITPSYKEWLSEVSCLGMSSCGGAVHDVLTARTKDIKSTSGNLSWLRAVSTTSMSPVLCDQKGWSW